MTKHIISVVLFVLLSAKVFGQLSYEGPNNPATVVQVPSFACLSCPGAGWMNADSVMDADGIVAGVGFNMYPNCFQSTCFYSRALVAETFKFTIPLSATITGIK